MNSQAQPTQVERSCWPPGQDIWHTEQEQRPVSVKHSCSSVMCWEGVFMRRHPLFCGDVATLKLAVPWRDGAWYRTWRGLGKGCLLVTQKGPFLQGCFSMNAGVWRLRVAFLYGVQLPGQVGRQQKAPHQTPRIFDWPAMTLSGKHFFFFPQGERCLLVTVVSPAQSVSLFHLEKRGK